jgi:hypothetical protein
MISQSPIFFRLVTKVVSEEEQSVSLSIFMVFTGTALHFEMQSRCNPVLKIGTPLLFHPPFKSPKYH